MDTLKTALTASFALAILGCQAVDGFEDFTAAPTSGSTASGAGTACADGSKAGDTETAKDGRVQVRVASASGCFWIDQLEVSIANYQAFLDSKDTKTAPATVCAASASHIPDPACVAGAPAPADGDPARCVNWCDAATYCRWAGGQLCSGSTGQWYAACSSNGANAYPYGSSHMAGACDTDGAAGPVAVGAENGCVTPVGVKDLVGNVEEWTDECSQSTGPTDECNVLGGSWQDTGTDATCKGLSSPKRIEVADVRGFRCCGL